MTNKQILRWSLGLLPLLALSGCNPKIKPNAARTPLVKNIPLSCTVANYRMIKGIYGSQQGYLGDRVFYSPVKAKDGLIKKDFNHDNLMDYIFLERGDKNKPARLVACLSQTSGKYQRQLSPISVREFKKPSLYIETNSIHLKGESLMVNFSTHAHNDGGEQERRAYMFDRQRQQFVLQTFEYSSFGEAFPEISQNFDLNSKRYHEETACFFANNPAAMGYSPNCKPRKQNKCLAIPAKPITFKNTIDRDVLKSWVTAC